MAIPALAPPNRPRTATVQRLTEDPTRGVVKRRSQSQLDRESIQRHYDLQRKAAAHARTEPARYPVAKIANAIARLEPQVQQRTGPGDEDWEPVDIAGEGDDETPRPEFEGLLDQYANRALGMGIKQLAGLQAYHYSVTGEYAIVVVGTRPDAQGQATALDYRIYPMSALVYGKPDPGLVTVRDVAGGRTQDKTAYVVPEEQVHRCWAPDPDHPGQATSPLLSGIGPLDRYHKIVRQWERETDSRWALGGGGKLLVLPAEAHAPKKPGGPDPIAQALIDIATIAQDPEDLRSLMPPEIHYDLTKGEAKVLDLGAPFSDATIAGLNAAFEAYAQTIDMPGLSVKAGGPGEANHWNEWVLQDENWQQAGAPVADRVYDDITRVFFREVMAPHLDIDPEEYRIGYDASEVVLRPNRSELATADGDEGILDPDARLRAHGFDPDSDSLLEPDWTKAEKRNWLLQVKSAGRVQPEGGPPENISIREQRQIGDGSTNGEPTRPTAPPALPPTAPSGRPALPPGQAAARAAAAVQEGAQLAKVNRVLAKLGQQRRTLHVRLQDAAKAAIRQAVEVDAPRRAAARVGKAKAGTRVAAMARDIPVGENPAETRAAYFASHGISGAWLAALGLTEEELLDAELAGLELEADALMAKSLTQQRKVLSDADFDPDLAGTDDTRHDGVAFLLAGASAVARSVLTTGPPAAPESGEWSGIVSGSLVADAIGILAGKLGSALGTTPDERPSAFPTGDQLLTELGSTLGNDVAEYTWVYGDSERQYEPHLELDGEASRDPESDWPAVDDWTDGDYMHPQDHDGCNCAWDVQFVPAGGEAFGEPAAAEAVAESAQ